jgi:maleate isomerase
MVQLPETPSEKHVDREYGSNGLFGIAVPQANPVVEPEMWSLAPPGVSLVTTRLQGSKVNSKNRLLEYVDNLAASLDAFDVAPVDAVGIACTGSSYLLGVAEEERQLARHEAVFKYPIITAAQAIKRSLSALNIRVISLVAPYPAWLVDACRGYWASVGIELAAVIPCGPGPADTRDVYGFTSGLVETATRDLDVSGVEAVVLTGTGVPTLKVMPEIARRTDRPVLSSNLCLMWSLLKLERRAKFAAEPMELLSTCRDLA